MNTSLHEIYTTVYWALLRESVPGFVKALNENILTHRQFNHEGMPGMFLTRSHNFEPQDATYVTNNPQRDIENPWYAYIEDDDQFIDLIPVNGGITRNAACGYGSRAQRDQVLYASKRPNCIGHIFLIDTPGGSAYSIEDYTEAINAAHEAGQTVIACIDGLCASAGYALACQCDSIYYTSPGNIVGCIGTMALYTTQKNGDQNTITQETYHEIYDPESYDKNIEFRNSAEGDDSLIVEKLKKCGQQFRDLVMKCRPQVKEEQIHGLTYEAAEVEGTLVDGRLNLQGCIDLLTQQADSAQQSSAESDDNPADPAPQDPPVDDPDNPDNPNPSSQQSSAEPKNEKEMIDNNIQTALVEAQAQIAALNDQLASAQSSLTEKEAALVEAQKALTDAEETKAQAIAEAVAERDTTIASLNEQLASAQQSTAEKDATLTETAKNLEEANNALAVAQTAITERDATIASLNEQLASAQQSSAEKEEALAKAQADIEELSHEPSSSATPTPATAGEGESDGNEPKAEDPNACREGMTAAQKRKALAEKEALLKDYH